MKSMMKKAQTCTGLIAALAILTVLPTLRVHAQTDPLGGKAAPGSKASVPDLEYQLKYQRAFEAAFRLSTGIIKG
jgi:hypothetical protein